MLNRSLVTALAVLLLPSPRIVRLAADARPEAAAPLTFYRDIAPITYRSCVPCHHDGGPGPFPLVTWNEVRKHASQIVTVTKTRYMPPWLPEPGHGDFEGEHERRLTDAQIAAFEQWVRSGAAAGSPGDAPALPKFVPGWQLGKPDLVIAATTAYHLRADGPDQYWNFVLPLPLTEARWIRALEIRPGNARAVHHANLYINAQIDRSREPTAGATLRDGFPGMDMTIAPVVFSADSDSYFLFWKPGGTNAVGSAEMAWKANPGTNLLLNVHMRTTGKPEIVLPSVGLYFTPHAGAVHPMILPLEHDGALNIPAGDRDFRVSDDFVTPVDLKVLAIYPHAHYLGHVLEGYATLPGGARQWLIRIPDWDQSWQSVYRYVTPLFLPRGTVLSMRYSYDNSAGNVRNPHQPPQRVRAGNQTTDEMAHLSLQVVPQGSPDSESQLREAIMQHRLQKYPGDFIAQFNLGVYMLQQKRNADAVRYLRAAVAAQPNQTEALDALAEALLAQNDANDAIGYCEHALQISPHDAAARANLGSALILQQRWQPAADQFRMLLADQPGNAHAQQQLAGLLRLLGYQSAMQSNLVQAVADWRESLHDSPNDAVLHNDLGEVLSRLGRNREAILEFEAALRINPGLERARRNLAAAGGSGKKPAH